MDVDSEENDIWNYKSVGKEKPHRNRVGQQEAAYSRLSVKPRKIASLPTQTRIRKKRLTAEGLYQQGATRKLDCGSSIEQGVVEVLDVDAENGLVPVYLPSNKNKQIAQASKAGKSLSSSTVTRVASGRSQLGHCKLSPPPVACFKPHTVRSANSLSTPRKCESVQSPGIQSYFSPSGEKRNSKRTSPKSGRTLFTELNNDELLIVHEEIANKQIKLGDSLAVDHVRDTASIDPVNGSMKSDICEEFSHSTEQEVLLHCTDVTGQSRAAVEEMLVDSHAINIKHPAGRGSTGSLAASLDSGYGSCVEKLHHSLMTSHDQLACSASSTLGSCFLVNTGDCDVEGTFSHHTLGDRCKLQTLVAESDGHLAPVDVPDYRCSAVSGASIAEVDVPDYKCSAVSGASIAEVDVPDYRCSAVSGASIAPVDVPDYRCSAVSGASIAPLKEDIAVMKTLLNVTSQTNSPSMTAQTNSPGVMAQTNSHHVVSQINSPSMTAQTNSPGVMAQTNSRHVVSQTNSPSVMAQTNSPSVIDKQSTLASVQKQTSIFSFFKARVGSSKTTGSMSKKLSTLPGLSCRQTSGGKRLQVSDPVFSQCQTSVVTPFKAGNSGRWRAVPSTSCAAVAGGQAELPPDSQQQQQYGAARKRQCPFYKKIHNTGITVDAFSYGIVPGCQAYILTHFHYDHYGGLTKKFAQPIYCSQVTGNLVEHRIGVDKQWIHRLQLWIPYQVAGVTLTLMEANHCPGAVMVLFELKDGRKVLHTGDFRANPLMESYPMLKGVMTSDVYLDTTYCDPSYTFPTQHEVINFAVSLVLNYVAHNPHTLVICGTYTIGKEKIFTAIAEALNSQICVTRDKKKVLDCLDDPELQTRLTLDWSQAQVHVLPMGKLNQQALFEHHGRHPKFTSVLALEPTGWSHSSKVSLESLRPKWSRNNVTLYGIPYSEHSSYQELKRFIQFIQPKKIIPTVNNGSPAARKKMEDIFSSWAKDYLSNQGAMFATLQGI